MDIKIKHSQIVDLPIELNDNEQSARDSQTIHSI